MPSSCIFLRLELLTGRPVRSSEAIRSAVHFSGLGSVRVLRLAETLGNRASAKTMIACNPPQVTITSVSSDLMPSG